MTSKKSAYFYKSFAFSSPGLLTEQQLNDLNQIVESKATEICAVNEKFHPEDVFADVFEKLTCKAELTNGKLILNLTARHKSSSIKFIEEKLKPLIEHVVPGSVFLEVVSRKKIATEKKTINQQISEPMSPVSNAGSIYLDKPEIEAGPVDLPQAPVVVNSQPSQTNVSNGQNLDDDDDNASIDSNVFNEEYKLWKINQQRAKMQQTQKYKPEEKKIDSTEKTPRDSGSFTISLNKETVFSFFLGFLSGSIVNGR